ncbi:aspartic proteinase sxa1 [Schizosaccharomyces japonicus yFS275]|uniref:Aspartic proteinase sxa1 n=1 Tax=Schizosaccharomyces japonicus (strain yFS275 / FY16936) TaxID=402676 RepID=B6JV52_SCHJY|nr:aspartic proteinase sxa1 [Schizosaccharomyces japonicus yFS275]EEB05253.1 aspartic proteinase sxa1 [Schizosaccharomyces japonicus yFS275]
MRISLGWILLAGILQTTTVRSATIVKRSDGRQLVSFPLNSNKQETEVVAEMPLLYERDTKTPELDATFSPSTFGYFVNLTIGTPAKQYQVLLDSGSPYTWITANNVTAYNVSDIGLDYTNGLNTSALRSSVCNTYQCYEFDSSSMHYNNTGMVGYLILYGDTTTVIGRNVYDTLNLGSSVLPGFQFGVTTREFDSASIGALGGIVGLSLPQTIYGVNEQGTVSSFKAPTFTNQLKQAGLINDTSFSLLLNDAGGELLFGGYDTDKISGGMHWLEVANTSIANFNTHLSSISVHVRQTNGQGTSRSTKYTEATESLNTTALFDCGTSSTGLPSEALQKIVDVYSGQLNNGIPYVACSRINTSDYLSFQFNKQVSVNLTVEHFILKRSVDGNDKCQLAFYASDGSLPILGVSFLKNVYTVYDYDAGFIGIALIKNVTKSHVVKIQEALSSYTAASTFTTSYLRT